jgi:hypothetical protein
MGKVGYSGDLKTSCEETNWEINALMGRQKES